MNWDAGGKSHKHTKWKAKQLSIELSNKQVKIILNIGGHILRAKWIKLDMWEVNYHIVELHTANRYHEIYLFNQRKPKHQRIFGCPNIWKNKINKCNL